MKRVEEMKRVLCVVASLAAVAALTGCGSSSNSSSGSASAQTAGLKGEPILIGTTATVNNPVLSFGGIFAGLKAGAAAVNKAGGVNGHPLKIWTCNSNYNPALELACARKAVAAGVIAMVGDSNTVSSFQSYAGILAGAGIADVENTGPLPNGFQGPNTFPVTWPLAQFLPCTSPQLAKLAGGNKVTGVATSNPTTVPLNELFAGLAKKQGLTWLKSIQVPLTASDYSSVVAEAEQSGANIVQMSLAGGGAQAFVKASSAAGAHYTICTAFGLTGAGWAGVGSAADKLYVGADFRPLTSNLPEIKRFLSEMAAQAATGDKDAKTASNSFQAETMEAWLGLQAAVQAAKTIKGPVTRPTFLAAMKKASVTFGGIVPPVDFAQPPETPARSSLPIVQPFLHVWSSPAYLWKWSPSTNKYTEVASYTDAFKAALTAPSH